LRGRERRCDDRDGSDWNGRGRDGRLLVGLRAAATGNCKYQKEDRDTISHTGEVVEQEDKCYAFFLMLISSLYLSPYLFS
jgi:hypothetical protein